MDQEYLSSIKNLLLTGTVLLSTISCSGQDDLYQFNTEGDNQYTHIDTLQTEQATATVYYDQVSDDPICQAVEIQLANDDLAYDTNCDGTVDAANLYSTDTRNLLEIEHDLDQLVQEAINEAPVELQAGR